MTITKGLLAAINACDIRAKLLCFQFPECNITVPFGTENDKFPSKIPVKFPSNMFVKINFFVEKTYGPFRCYNFYEMVRPLGKRGAPAFLLMERLRVRVFSPRGLGREKRLFNCVDTAGRGTSPA